MTTKERFVEDDVLAAQSVKDLKRKVTLLLTQGEFDLLTAELTGPGNKRDSLIGLVIKKAYKRGDINIRRSQK